MLTRIWRSHRIAFNAGSSGLCKNGGGRGVQYNEAVGLHVRTKRPCRSWQEAGRNETDSSSRMTLFLRHRDKGRDAFGYIQEKGRGGG